MRLGTPLVIACPHCGARAHYRPLLSGNTFGAVTRVRNCVCRSIHEFFQEEGGIHSSISLPDLSKLFTDIAPPTDPELIVDVLYEIKEKIIRHSVKVGNPFYIGMGLPSR